MNGLGIQKRILPNMREKRVGVSIPGSENKKARRYERRAKQRHPKERINTKYKGKHCTTEAWKLGQRRVCQVLNLRSGVLKVEELDEARRFREIKKLLLSELLLEIKFVTVLAVVFPEDFTRFIEVQKSRENNEKEISK